MKLVIVESPTKCTTIKKYLGSDYNVVASKGHIRDLATSGKNGFGVDIENGFVPSYRVNKDKAQTVKYLQMEANKADEVILATDPDREGEAIAWHLANVLNLPIQTTKRLEFHEITRDSISEAIKNPRTINMNLVSSQETRRILDRIIGFGLSSLIYRMIRSRSAGRVQSATLKLINDHELEIAKFVPEEYWVLSSKCQINDKPMSLTFLGDGSKNFTIHNEKEANDILNSLKNEFTVSSINKTIRLKESKEPFTTSTLQQEAFARLKFKTKKTQMIAQQLYEGLDIGGEHVGLITYMRTDSPRLSETFVKHATDYILEKYGENYLGVQKKGKKNLLAQDAHEAIRQTSNHRTPESVRAYLTADQYNLYKLIYNRTLASLMKPKKDEVFTAILLNDKHQFKLELSHNLFKGYEIVLADIEEGQKFVGDFPEIKEGDKLPLLEKKVEQKFTQAPAHYTEAKLVKLMEELGIGRPSTYDSTISNLGFHQYVNNVSGVLTMTERGSKTAHVLEKYFPEIVDAKYTAQMEEKLDEVESGNTTRLAILNNFYEPFQELCADVKKRMYIDDPETVGTCPECGAPLIVREGKNGKFIGCSNYPTCKYVKKDEPKEVKYTGGVCPKCGKPLVERKDKKGNTFIACSGYPTCKYIEQKAKKEVTFTEKDYVRKCPDCDGYLVKKKGKYGTFLGCTNYPKCKHMEKIDKKERK